MDTGITLYQRYGVSGKWVCFDCRVCFHKWGVHSLATVPCNNCKKSMTLAGYSFRAPRKSDTAAWSILEVLIRDGAFFYKGGGVSKVPSTVKEAKRSRDKKHKGSRFAIRRSNGKRVELRGLYHQFNFGSMYQLP